MRRRSILRRVHKGGFPLPVSGDGGQRVENAAQKYLASRAQRGFPLPRAVSPVAPLSQTLNKKTAKESPSILLSRPRPRTRAPERRADETLKLNSPSLRSTSINHARGLRATLGRTNPGLLLGPGLTQGTLSEAYISPPRESEIRTPSSQASP